MGNIAFQKISLVGFENRRNFFQEVITTDLW